MRHFAAFMPRASANAGFASRLGQQFRSISMKPASRLSEPLTVNVIGAPMSYGQPLAGAEKAPVAIREAGLRGAVTKLGWRWVDSGDAHIPPPSVSAEGGAGAAAKLPAGFRARNSATVGQGNYNIFKLAKAAASSGSFVLTLGGDHSVAMGSIAGILTARPNLGIVWVDAHADINNPGSSPSGNIHGMPLSFLLRLIDPKAIPGCEWMETENVPKLEPSQVVYIGLRDLDEPEKEAIRDLKIRAYTMTDVDRLGIGSVLERTLKYLGDRPLHLSFDIDGVDPSVAPSTGTAVMGGLNYRESHYIAERLHSSGLLGSMDMVEINPDIVPGQGAVATVTAGLDLISSALGKSILPPSLAED